MKRKELMVLVIINLAIEERKFSIYFAFNELERL